MKARIYQPAKTAMQSGRADTKTWRLDYNPAGARFIEPLMGWTGTHDTQGQVRLDFPTSAAAVAYAERYGISFEIEAPKAQKCRRQTYADNFSYYRIR